jgi:predicted extracellular nuclease
MISVVHRFSALLAVAVCLFACGATEEQRPSTEPKAVGPTRSATVLKPMPASSAVVFYNVENLFDTRNDPSTNDEDFLPEGELHWTQDRLATKLDRLGSAIQWAGGAQLPVLVGLCEVENADVVEALARSRNLISARYAVVHHDSPDERGIDVALLYDPEHLTLIGSKPLTVPLAKDRTRDILHATLASTTDTFHVFVNHWPSRGEGQLKSEPKRMAAARVLAQAVKGIRTGATTHLLIMGDFNDTPMDSSIQEGLAAGCTSTDALIDLMCVDQPEGHGSHQYDGHWDYLDQFVVGKALAARVASAKALWDKRLLFKHPRYGLSPNKTYSGGSYKGGYSDHLPIVLRLK